MLITDIIRAPFIAEAVAISSNHQMAAYAITVAEAYDALPRSDAKAVPLWQAFAQQNDEVMLKKIASSGIKIEYSAEDPYEHLTNDPRMMVRYMLWDMVVNKRLPVYTGHSDDHPVFTPQQNVVFRTVHDYFAHGVLRATFKKQVDALGLTNQAPSPAQLAQILPTIKLDQGGNIGHQFTMRGEINAYLTHSKLASPKNLPVLFTEVVGQVCYQCVVGNFPQQKVGIMRDFDYLKVGVGQGAVQQRINQLMQQFTTEQAVRTSIAAKPTVVVSELIATVGR
jgi:hypothetical protein